MSAVIKIERRAKLYKRGWHKRANVARGLDAAGRFIGPHDIEHGYHYFWVTRGGAPKSRDLSGQPTRAPGAA